MAINTSYVNNHKKTLNTKKIEKLNYWISEIDKFIPAIPTNIKSYNDIIETYDDSVKLGIKMEDTKEGYIQKRDAMITQKTTIQAKRKRLTDLKAKLENENKTL